jgi:hypothetical protein
VKATEIVVVEVVAGAQGVEMVALAVEEGLSPPIVGRQVDGADVFV